MWKALRLPPWGLLNARLGAHLLGPVSEIWLTKPRLNKVLHAAVVCCCRCCLPACPSQSIRRAPTIKTPRPHPHTAAATPSPSRPTITTHPSSMQPGHQIPFSPATIKDEYPCASPASPVPPYRAKDPGRNPVSPPGLRQTQYAAAPAACRSHTNRYLWRATQDSPPCVPDHRR